jgi:uncharacterized protein YecE (DUF72 family)
MVDVRVGVCGFCLPQAELFRRFRLLEIQQTFYWPPQLKTVERWRQDAPDDFEFTLKAFQAITHSGFSPTYRRARLTEEQKRECGDFRDTKVVRDGWDKTLCLATALAATVVLFQCPPKFTATEQNISQLRRFFLWASRGSLRFAWEPRHASWTAAIIAELCRELDLIQAGDPLERRSMIGSPSYFRLHGQPLGKFAYDYDKSYCDAELQDILDRCQTDPTYCLFNNKQMAEDADRFSKLRNPNDAVTSRQNERTGDGRRRCFR